MCDYHSPLLICLYPVGSVSLENPEGDSEDIHLVVTDTLEIVEDLGLNKLVQGAEMEIRRDSLTELQVADI